MENSHNHTVSARFTLNLPKIHIIIGIMWLLSSLAPRADNGPYMFPKGDICGDPTGSNPMRVYIYPDNVTAVAIIGPDKTMPLCALYDNWVEGEDTTIEDLPSYYLNYRGDPDSWWVSENCEYEKRWGTPTKFKWRWQSGENTETAYTYSNMEYFNWPSPSATQALSLGLFVDDSSVYYDETLDPWLYTPLDSLPIWVVEAILDFGSPVQPDEGGFLALGDTKPLVLSISPIGIYWGDIKFMVVEGEDHIEMRDPNGGIINFTPEDPLEASLLPYGPGFPFVVPCTIKGMTVGDVVIKLAYFYGVDENNDPLLHHEDIVKVTVFDIDMVTPAGDPVTSPDNAGDGQNEFAYDQAVTGVLTMNLKAQVTPSGAAAGIKDQCHFTVSAIGSSTVAWDDLNPGGKPTASGDFLEATVTYTGLPANNTDFGIKMAAIYYDGDKKADNVYEVFYLKTEKNHPGAGGGTTPNWFFYWGPSVQYLLRGDPKPTLQYGGSTIFHMGNTYITLSDITAGAYNGPLGLNNTLKGIDTFAYAAVHESIHYYQALTWWGNNPATILAANGKEGANDTKDSDWLPNNIEDTNLNKIFDRDMDNAPTGNFPGAEDVDTDGDGILNFETWDWSKILTPGVPDINLLNDHEWWNCLEGKSATGDHSKDWGKPGMQHDTLDIYND